MSSLYLVLGAVVWAAIYYVATCRRDQQIRVVALIFMGLCAVTASVLHSGAPLIVIELRFT